MEKKIRPINTRISEYKALNAQPVLLAVEKWIRILETKKREIPRWSYRYKTSMYEVCHELSIFDWWVDTISISRLKEMRTFLKEAIKLGYTGYVCFKVGIEGCANGMWAHKVPTTDGYSPDGEFLYKSFTPSYNYWDVCDDTNGYGDKSFRLSRAVGKEYDELTTIKALEEALRQRKEVA